MKFAFISQNEESFGIEDLCSALEVSRSGYYAWKTGEVSTRQAEDAIFKEKIVRLHKQSKERYGYRPIYSHLKQEGIACGRDRTLRLMREKALQGSQPSRFKPLGTDSNHNFGYSPNLLKDREMPTAKDEVWVADTTYLRTAEGWRYFAAVMDLGTRRLLGWSISEKNDTDLVCAALRAAAGLRGEVRRDIIHHSDRGSTYASYSYQNLLSSLGMLPSMSARGNCYDNAAMESFFGRFKTSTVRNRVFANEAEARSVVFEYVEVFYNRFRKHSSLGYLTPLEFEEMAAPPMGGLDQAMSFTNN